MNGMDAHPRMPPQWFHAMACVCVLIPLLYVGSVFVVAYAVGAGWMSVESANELVDGVHRPIFDYTAVKERPGVFLFDRILEWVNRCGLGTAM